MSQKVTLKNIRLRSDTVALLLRFPFPLGDKKHTHFDLNSEQKKLLLENPKDPMQNTEHSKVQAAENYHGRLKLDAKQIALISKILEEAHDASEHKSTLAQLSIGITGFVGKRAIGRSMMAFGLWWMLGDLGNLATALFTSAGVISVSVTSVLIAAGVGIAYYFVAKKNEQKIQADLLHELLLSESRHRMIGHAKTEFEIRLSSYFNQLRALIPNEHHEKYLNTSAEIALEPNLAEKIRLIKELCTSEHFQNDVGLTPNQAHQLVIHLPDMSFLDAQNKPRSHPQQSRLFSSKTKSSVKAIASGLATTFAIASTYWAVISVSAFKVGALIGTTGVAAIGFPATTAIIAVACGVFIGYKMYHHFRRRDHLDSQTKKMARKNSQQQQKREEILRADTSITEATRVLDTTLREVKVQRAQLSSAASYNWKFALPRSSEAVPVPPRSLSSLVPQ